MSEASLLCDPFYVSIDDFAVLMSNHIDHIYIYKRPLPCVSEEMSSKAAFSGRFIVDMGGFGHRVNSDSIRNGGAI